MWHTHPIGMLFKRAIRSLALRTNDSASIKHNFAVWDARVEGQLNAGAGTHGNGDASVGECVVEAPRDAVVTRGRTTENEVRSHVASQQWLLSWSRHAPHRIQPHRIQRNPSTPSFRDNASERSRGSAALGSCVSFDASVGSESHCTIAQKKPIVIIEYEWYDDADVHSIVYFWMSTQRGPQPRVTFKRMTAELSDAVLLFRVRLKKTLSIPSVQSMDCAATCYHPRV